MTVETDGLVFGDPPPPPRKGRAQRYEPFREALVTRPGEWAQLPGLGGQGWGSTVKKALGTGFEVTSRTDKEKDDQGRCQYRIWVRYIGDVS